MMRSLANPLRSVAGRYCSPLRGRPSQVDWLRSIRSSASVSPPSTTLGSLARRRRLEAVLWLAQEPLSIRKLASMANLVDGTEARTLLGELQRRYDARGCAFQIEQIAGGYQLLSRPEFASWLRPAASESPETGLSTPAMETLSVVAYRQPVIRAEIEAIRGVGCGEILRRLMDRDLLRIVGRSEELGRPLLYGTTKRFLQTFGLHRLDQLPQTLGDSQHEPG